MIELAQGFGTASPQAAIYTSIGAVIVAILAGTFGWRNAGRANMSKDQREWLQTALDEARKAKSDANDAEQTAGRAGRAANDALHRAEDAERRLLQVQSTADDLMSWIGRVVTAAHDVDRDAVDDPATTKLLTLINGGPAALTSSQLRRSNGDTDTWSEREPNGPTER